MSDDSNDTSEKDRAFAAFFIDTYERTIPAFQQRATDASKWTLAALLTVNGGGALATLNAADRFSNPSHPAALFLIGMCLTVLSAASIRLEYETDLKRTNALYARAKRAVAGLDDPVGLYREITDEILADKIISNVIIKYTATALEILSGVLFLLGAIVALITVDPDTEANEARCRALQKDFLSPLPVRSDSREVFETLKCKAQGEGSVFAPYDGDKFDVAIERARRRDQLPLR